MKRILSVMLAVLLCTLSEFSFCFADESAASVNGRNDAASAVSFSIRTYNETRTEDDQNIEVVLTFDKNIKVSSGAEADVNVKIAGAGLNEMPSTENGQSNRTLAVSADPSDASKLVITIGSKAGAQFVKQTNARLEICAAGGGVTHILTADSDEPVNLRYMSCVIPNGLTIETVDSVQGSASQCASVTKAVTHRSNVRSMVYIQVLRDGKPLLPTESFDHEGSYVIHAHAFIDTMSGSTLLNELTEADYAKLIVDGFNNSVKNYADIRDGYTMTASEGKLTLNANLPEEGENLDVRIFAWPEDDSYIADTAISESSENLVFTDVSGWEKEYVYYLSDRGIVRGKTETEFCPLDNITRAEFLTVLASASGADVSTYTESAFSDVKAGTWYAPYVQWAYSQGIVKGSNGLFQPSANITRQDMAVMIENYTNVQNNQLPKMETLVTFTDDGRIADYAKSAVYALQTAGIVSGDVNGKYLPESSATRAQAAKIVALYIQVTGMERT